MPLPLFTDQQIYRRQPQNVISRVFPIFKKIHLCRNVQERSMGLIAWHVLVKESQAFCCNKDFVCIISTSYVMGAKEIQHFDSVAM